MTANLEYYKVFYYVAKTGSLTQAAAILSISQPAVSQSMKLLEVQTGAKLFSRVSKGVRLTAEGEMLYSYVSKGYEQIEAGEQKLKQMLNLELGEIRIGASDMTLQFYLLPYLELFHEKNPGIKVLVTNAPTPDTLDFLYEGKIDFGVISEPFEARVEIRSVPVREIQDIFVAGSRFIELKDKLLDFKELEALPIICLEHNTSTRRYVDDFLKANDVVLMPEFELAMSDIIMKFAERNLGIGCVVEDFAKEYIANGRLFQLKFRKELPKRHFCIITGSQNPISSAAKELLTMLGVKPLD